MQLGQEQPLPSQEHLSFSQIHLSQSQPSGNSTVIGSEPGTSITIPSKPPFLIMARVSPISNATIAMIEFLLLSVAFIMLLHKKRGEDNLTPYLLFNYLSSFLSILSRISAILRWSVTTLVIILCISLCISAQLLGT